MTAGTSSFKFNSYPSELRYKTSYPVTWTTGRVGAPNSGSMGGSLTINDKDSFNINNYRFVRGRIEGGQLVNTPAILSPQRKTIIRNLVIETLDDNGNVIKTKKQRIIETIAEKEGGYWSPNSDINQQYGQNFP